MLRLKHIGVLDDERMAVESLVHQLKAILPTVEVVGFRVVQEFMEWAKKNEPQIVFLDMEMPNAFGLDLAKDLQEFVGNIVFATAHPQYSLEAFQTPAVDFILKPVNSLRLEQCLSKINDLQPTRVPLGGELRIPIKGGFNFINHRDILYLKGQRNYTEIFFTNQKPHLVARTLKSFMEELGGSFLRVHKSIAINSCHLDKVEWGNKPKVVLDEGTVLEASKVRLNELGYFS